MDSGISRQRGAPGGIRVVADDRYAAGHLTHSDGAANAYTPAGADGDSYSGANGHTTTHGHADAGTDGHPGAHGHARTSYADAGAHGHARTSYADAGAHGHARTSYANPGAHGYPSAHGYALAWPAHG